ncbi:MAG TPA: 5-oxoprolinase, partial [Rhodospirillales bacterium]|nr:5-oxoprolinase [Rhodospirillales bacterium]
HACRIADTLGMNRVFVHPLAGVLSAYGMGLAHMRAMRERSLEVELGDAVSDQLEQSLALLKADAEAEILGQQIPADRITILGKAHLRYQGTDTAIIVDFGTPKAMAKAFEEAHIRRFGFNMPERALVVETLSVEAIGATDDGAGRAINLTRAEPGEPLAVAAMISGGVCHQAPVYERTKLASGQLVEGPAIIVEDTGTTVVEAAWQALISEDGSLVLSRAIARPQRVALGTGMAGGKGADPVMLEIFNNLFMSIAEQMGAVLANTAYSVNIKERLDFSCAVFDRHGELVANAPHMPVHLGSMGESVQTVIRERGDTMKPGDVSVLNAPYNGGTHLPDITVITPVFDKLGQQVLFFIASRGHHADIGGITPGSMPPNSTSVDQEGILIDNFLLVEQGHFREHEMLELLTGGPWPARNPGQNLADLRAQVAANEKGVYELKRMVDHFGLDMVQAYMGHVQDNAEESVRRVLDVLRDGEFAYQMDGGATIRVAISMDAKSRSATVDFSGTSDQLANNFNAPYSVTRAAVLYVFRTLVDDDIPLNAGCLKPIDIIMPETCMLRPAYPAAVVAGNVETSQAVVDTLYGALGVMAAAQGTMNNLTFGDDTHQYYETICGGTGAGPGFAGTDAVHSHMTNSRLTDPEVLEWRFPVLLEDFTIRRGSGGGGKYKGGDGTVRRLRFLEPMTAAILSGHRVIPPYGMAGGESGALGKNRLQRANGEMVLLGGTGEDEALAGDVFVVETPGGGGYGPPED